jgi:RimJ/RimL family protein N-acetyltransferase
MGSSSASCPANCSANYSASAGSAAGGFGDLTLHSSRLTLRPWLAADAGPVFEAASVDPWMKQFLPIPDPYTRADADFFVGDLGHDGRYDGTGLGCALVETATGRLVGGAGIRLATPRHGRCHLGYSVYPWARGNGYAAEAADALARWAFDQGVRRVELQASVRNLASITSALRAGFRYEGIERQQLAIRADDHDAALFARLVSDSASPIAPVLPRLPDGGLSDGVVTLRVTLGADAPALIEADSDPVSVSWQLSDAPVDAEAVTAAAEAAGLLWLVGPVGRLTIVDVETAAAAGSMQLRLSGPPRVAEIGYTVHPAFRGRGYTSRGLRLLTAWAFDQAGLARLELGAKVANIASQQAARNAGYEPDGIMRGRLRNPDGSFSDEARFAAISPGR